MDPKISTPSLLSTLGSRSKGTYTIRHTASHQLPLLTPVGKPGGFDLGTVRSFFSFLAHRTVQRSADRESEISLNQATHAHMRYITFLAHSDLFSIPANPKFRSQYKHTRQRLSTSSSCHPHDCPYRWVWQYLRPL